MSRKLPKTLPPVESYEDYQALVRATWSEAQFLREVESLAKQCGWLTFHTRTAMSMKGKYMTAVSGAGVGFPDLLMLRRDEMIVAELKVGYNKTTERQEEWLAAFRQLAGQIDVCVWTPQDWPQIERMLK